MTSSYSYSSMIFLNIVQQYRLILLIPSELEISTSGSVHLPPVRLKIRAFFLLPLIATQNFDTLPSPVQFKMLQLNAE